MAILVIAQKLIFPFKISVRSGRETDFSSNPYHIGAVTFVILVLIFLSAIGYLVATYFVFGAGFTIQENSQKLAELETTLIKKELALQKEKINLAGGGSTLLQSMQEAVLIKYLIPEGVVASEIIPQP